MPRYVYRCKADGCGLHVELVRPIEDRSKVKGLSCGKPGHKGLLKLQVQAVPGIVKNPAAGPRRGT